MNSTETVCAPVVALAGMTNVATTVPAVVSLMLVPVIQAIPRDVQAAAYTLRASRLRVFWSVTLPLTAPGILSGSILVYVLTISALVTPRMLGGPTYKVMATLIYDDFLQTLEWPSGAALSFTLTAMTLVIISISSRLLKRWGGQA